MLPNKISRISELIMPCFHESWANQRKFTHNVEKGGRNSGKSTLHAIRIVYNRMITKTSGLCVRRYANSLRDSMYVDINWAIDFLGTREFWSCTINPLKAVYKPTGTVILFKGADDSTRLKGIKTKYPIADCWFDELADFKQEEDLDAVTNSVLRGKIDDKYTFLYSYNPPKRKNNWCNKKYNTNKPVSNTFVHHSTFYTNIHATETMYREADIMKLDNELKYRWIYLGEPIGGGLVPFNNLVFRTITDEEIKTFDNIKAGIDWGYATNPFCYGRAHYDRTRRRLFFINEIMGLQMSNEYIIGRLLKNKWLEYITADSASPKDIKEFRDAGIPIIGSKKGPGSIEFGERWLNDNLDEIVIDWNRTPKIAKQFEDIDYAVDRSGELLDRLEDKENDAIDMSRYMMERDMGYGARMY